MAAPHALDRLLTPRRVIGALVVLVVLTVLLTPHTPTAEGDPRLTSYSTSDGGARALFQTARRLGWRVEQRTVSLRAPLDSSAVYAVIAPVVEPTSGEVGRLLAAVRAGAGLIVTPAEDTPLADSLHLRASRWQAWSLEVPMDSSGKTPVARDPRLGPYHNEISHYLVPTGPLRPDTVVFLRMTARMIERREADDSAPPRQTRDTTYGPRPVVMGYPLGRGRIVAIADDDMLRNSFLREEPARAVIPIRALEWVTPPGGRRLVFDEYHQGFGSHASTWRTIWRALVGTVPGRVLAQVLVAILLVMLVAAARPVAPPPRLRIERRSPLEHVGALARAYEQIGATRLGARRLVRGLRRRHAVGAARAAGDEEFLGLVAARHPALGDEVDRVRAAIERPVPASAFREVGDAIATIDRTLSQ